MRILLVSSFYWPQIGGVETFVRHFAKWLVRRGHTVCVVAAHGDVHMPDVVDDDGVSVNRFPFREALERRDPEMILNIHRAFGALKREFAPEIIHINCFSPPLFFHQRLENVAPAPSVVTLHWMPEHADHAMRGIFRSTFATVAAIAAISTYQFDVVESILPGASEKCSLIPNGIEEISESGNCDSAIAGRILCIGRIVTDKGFDYAIEAFATIAERFPLAQLVIAGNGVERKDLLRLANELGIAGRVVFRGWVDHENVANELARASIVVVPSRTETFGLVAVEAAQVARPVIASDVGGLRDIVVDNETGILVKSGSVSGFSDAMAKLLNDPALAATLGAQGQDRAARLFGADRAALLYETLFERITTENANGVAG